MRKFEEIIKAGISVALLLLMAASASAAWDKQYEHTFQQDVEGEGFAMVRHSVNAENLQLLNYMHGSGTIDAATLISSNKSMNEYCKQDRISHVYLGDKQKAYSNNISFLEQNEMVYAPVAMAYGTGYYAENPIIYNSKLKEKTWGKNRQDGMGVSMHHQIEYASAFVKDIGVDLQCRDVVGSKAGYTSSPEDGYGLARMRIEEEVTEGTVHIGELVAGTGDDCKGNNGWKNPKIEIDENYVGTFKIQKNMEYLACKPKSSLRADWLSCCIGGYGSMDGDDKLWDEKGIFDCTCRDVAWGKSWGDKSREQSLNMPNYGRYPLKS
ncbi:hypothetical protein [Methanothrix harundinacea]|uniref:Uncharacterized protein n=1 Tax=Methanothrix harundinacea (strain 6Ac) TaxID=1110509 RepID=G7WMC6_METH6|nr:hypothetical protein [Methanothrix harundinacea]AET63791.1 hypothetical protein Mhar_0405 [Methanothrix harundinacea 6Ac]